MKRKQIKKTTKVLLAIAILLIMISSGCLEGTVKKVSCRQVTKYRTEQYQVTEEWRGCDKDSRCGCTHKSWGGLGSCDTCVCIRERRVAYQEEVCR